MGVDGGAALIPEYHRQPRDLAQHIRHGLRLFRPGTPGSVHVLWVPQYQLFRAVLGGQLGDLLRHCLGAVGVDGGGEARKKTSGVGNGDAGVGVTVVDGHNAHMRSSLSRCRAFPPGRSMALMGKNCPDRGFMIA